jgi:hypothetical protein
VTIAFTGSTDNVGLKWYVARVEGVRAVDQAGNRSAPTPSTLVW